MYPHISKHPFVADIGTLHTCSTPAVGLNPKAKVLTVISSADPNAMAVCNAPAIAAPEPKPFEVSHADTNYKPCFI